MPPLAFLPIILCILYIPCTELTLVHASYALVKRGVERGLARRGGVGGTGAGSRRRRLGLARLGLGGRGRPEELHGTGVVGRV